MKAFLSYPDRDFDPTLLLSRREKASHQRQKDPTLDLRHALPWNHAALVQDLGLGFLLGAMAANDEFLLEAAMVGLLGSVTDARTIRYRQDVLHDCLRKRAIVREMYNLAVEALQGERKHRWLSFGRYPAGTLHHAVEVLEVFVSSLRRLRQLADNNVAELRIGRIFTALSHVASGTRRRVLCRCESPPETAEIPGRCLNQRKARKG